MDRRYAFEGIKVADFAWVGVGPITTKYLADHGATVIRIESHTRPDVLRLAGPRPGPALRRLHRFHRPALCRHGGDGRARLPPSHRDWAVHRPGAVRSRAPFPRACTPRLPSQRPAAGAR